MKIIRRQFLHLAAGAVALPAVSRIASAQAYPSRPITLLVGATKQAEAAKSLIKFLTALGAIAVLKAKGLDPG
jgi:hypothetical protein